MSVFKELILKPTPFPIRRNVLKLVGKYSNEPAAVIEKVLIEAAESSDQDAKIVAKLLAKSDILRAKLKEGPPLKEDNSRALDRAADITHIINTAAKSGLYKLPPLLHDDNINILDVGCADGSILVALRQKMMPLLPQVEGHSNNQINLYGTDIYDPSIPPAAGIKFKINDEKSLPFENESMDIIISLMTMHHLKNLDNIIGEMRRILKPGGIFIFREHDLPEASEGHKDEDFAAYTTLFLELVHYMEDGIFFPIDFSYKEKCIDSSGGIPADIVKFFSRHWAKYRSARDWERVVNSAGLRQIYFDKYPFNNNNLSMAKRLLENPQQVYYAAAVKLS